MPISGYTGCKVFSGTRPSDRDQLGERMTAWLGANPDVEVIATVTVQSSDHAFHCLSLVIFYRVRP